MGALGTKEKEGERHIMSTSRPGGEKKERREAEREGSDHLYAETNYPKMKRVMFAKLRETEGKSFGRRLTCEVKKTKLVIRYKPVNMNFGDCHVRKTEGTRRISATD